MPKDLPKNSNPAKPVELAKDLLRELKPYFDLPCRGGRMYLGSMFFLDFGRPIPIKFRDGSTGEKGEFRLGIRDVDWVIKRDGRPSLGAPDATKAEFSTHASDLVGTHIQDVSGSDKKSTVTFHFDNGYAIEIDLANRFDTDAEILVATLPNGKAVGIENNILISDFFADGT